MMRKITSMLIAFSLIFTFSSCSLKKDTDETTVPSAETVDYAEATTTVKLNGASAEINGTGAEFKDGDIIISSSGTYGFSGTLTDGRIIVNADKQAVTVLLCNVDITCKDSSAIFIYKSASAKIIAEGNTVNTLTDGSSYSYSDSYSSQADEEPNACLFSKSDLSIGGSGTLTVNGNFNNGITSKDTLTVSDASITVNAKNHGINGKDSASINNATIKVISGGDSIRSTNDTDATLGYININSSNITLQSGEDAIQAQTALTISKGTYSITAGGGSAEKADDSLSTKGIKAGTTLKIDDGTFKIDSSDDSIHGGGNVTIAGGTFSINSGDDGIHSDETLTISGGNINISKSYEGFEGTNIVISGGTSTVTASDDGLNSAGGVDSSGFGGMDAGGFGQSNSNSSIKISGGYTVVNSGGDGIDSNGSVEMTDGTVIVYGPTDNGNAALDYDSGFSITGGTLIAEGSSGMAQVPSSSSIYMISATFPQSVQAGTYISISDGTESFVFKTQKAIGNLVFASPELQKGKTYTISYGGTYSGGSDKNGIMSGGKYSSGTTLTSLTLTDYISSYGSVGMGGSMGGMKGGMGAGMNRPGF